MSSKRSFSNMLGRRFTMTGECEPVVQRNGDCNIAMVNMKKQRARYMADLYTTIVDAQWRYTLLIFISGFTFSWLFFGFIWYLIIVVHQDDIPRSANDSFVPCVMNVKSFAGAFLFSLESQHTIGYGVRAITEECPTAICVLCVQSITGVILQAFMAGVVFAKLTRSKKRANTLQFSKKAVVCLRDNKLVLMFRVADLRKSLIVGATVHAQLIRPRQTAEGEVLPYHMTKVKVGSDDYSDDLLFIWPITIVHVIDQDSPFYSMDAASMLNERFEMIVYLEGTSESTGTTMQARYSYRNGDVLWGNRFEQTIRYDKRTMNYVIDFEKMESTVSVPTPLVSAKDWEEIADRSCCISDQAANKLVAFNASNFQEFHLNNLYPGDIDYPQTSTMQAPSSNIRNYAPFTTDGRLRATSLCAAEGEGAPADYEVNANGYERLNESSNITDNTGPNGDDDDDSFTEQDTDEINLTSIVTFT